MSSKIITIERQYASGGRAIGQMLSEKLGIPVYGREILEMVAERNGTSIEFVEHIEESSTNSLLFNFAISAQAMINDAGIVQNEQNILKDERAVIRELADKGDCIIVGRCAGSVLLKHCETLRVFVYADMEDRVRRAREEYGIDDRKIESVIRKIDRRRSNFYNLNSDYRWDDREGYCLMLNSSALGIEKCVDAIIAVK